MRSLKLKFRLFLLEMIIQFVYSFKVNVLENQELLSNEWKFCQRNYDVAFIALAIDKLIWDINKDSSQNKVSKIKLVHWIEYEDWHYLSIWTKAPWLNRVQFRCPLFICKFF